MPETPPTANPPPAPLPPGSRRVSLREIAAGQRRVNFAILGYFALLLLFFILPPSLRPYFRFVLVATVIAGGVAAYLLGKTLFGSAGGILVGVTALLFPVSLVALLALNGRATRLLRENAVPVGFLGARIAEVP